MSDIVQELNDAAESKSGASLRHGCVECGLSSAMCSNAADEIDKLRAALVTAQAERDAARQALARRQHQKGCPSLGIGGAVERNCTCGVNALRAELDAARQEAAAVQDREAAALRANARLQQEREELIAYGVYLDALAAMAAINPTMHLAKALRTVRVPTPPTETQEPTR